MQDINMRQQQQNATAQLLTAQAATLEVMGETCALSEPNAHSNFGKVKNNPCILCKQRYTTEEILHNHILKEHREMLDAFVSINSMFFHFKFECFLVVQNVIYRNVICMYYKSWWKLKTYCR